MDWDGIEQARDRSVLGENWRIATGMRCPDCTDPQSLENSNVTNTESVVIPVPPVTPVSLLPPVLPVTPVPPVPQAAMLLAEHPWAVQRAGSRRQQEL